MKKIILTMLLAAQVAMGYAQLDRTVKNRPYTDLRPFHFGVVLGSHLQDMELNNAGLQTIANEDGSTMQTLVTADQDRWDAGLNVGVLGELRLSEQLQFRIAPTMYFGNRHLTFHNLKEQDGNGNAVEEAQNLKSVYIASTINLIYGSERNGNIRPYLVGGISPVINLSSHSSDIIETKRNDVFAEIGLGCDIYLPFFKLRPELKFMYSLLNSLDENHAKKLKDKTLLPYAQSVNITRSKMIVLSFHFE